MKDTRDVLRRAAGSFLRMRALGWFTALWVISLSLSLKAEILTRDLGEELRYFRAQVLPTDLPSADVKPGPLVLDLRYTLAETDAAMALDAWLKFRATEKTPVFLLINPDTAPVLRELLIASASRPGVITIGRKTNDTRPDIAIITTAEEEQRAYDALARTKAVDSLLLENADKARVDEASIMRARTEIQDEPVEANPLDRIAPSQTKTEPAQPALIDRALQRAVHLHRAMRALKRL